MCTENLSPLDQMSWGGAPYASFSPDSILGKSSPLSPFSGGSPLGSPSASFAPSPLLNGLNGQQNGLQQQDPLGQAIKTLLSEIFKMAGLPDPFAQQKQPQPPVQNQQPGQSQCGCCCSGSQGSGAAGSADPTASLTPQPSLTPGIPQFPGAPAPQPAPGSPSSPPSPTGGPSPTDPPQPGGTDLRSRMVANARQLANSGLRFSGDMENQQYNPQYWEQVNIDGNSFWKVKDGVNPSTAVQDVFNNPNRYAIDCAAAINLIGMKSILDTTGAADFNNKYAGLTMRGWLTKTDAGGWDTNGALSRVTGSVGSPHNPAGMQPGDVMYISNPSGAGTAWQGENVIYLGKDEQGQDLYFGHPFGIMTAQQILSALDSDGQTDAYVTNIHGYV